MKIKLSKVGSSIVPDNLREHNRCPITRIQTNKNFASRLIVRKIIDTENYKFHLHASEWGTLLLHRASSLIVHSFQT
jgi:hypothetical protein